MSIKKAQKKSNGTNAGFEETLWSTADKMRNNMDPAEYKHVVLGLIFLKYISDSFEEVQNKIKNDADHYDGQEEDRDAYLSEGVFWVPQVARWDYLKSNAKKPEIGKMLDDAMISIEKDNPSLKGVLAKNYARPDLDKVRLGELIDMISTIGLGDKESRSKDILGRVYEYFLGRFAGAEGKGGGEFFTPQSVVKLLVEMLEPYKGRIYDPCCGSGGMFVQSEKFVEAHGGSVHDIAVYGQESNPTTWKLCKMNLAIRGIEGNIGQHYADTFHNDLHKDLKADFILANPPFNISDWGGDRIKDDVRWKYGTPSEGNANYAWIQHMIHHLAPTGIAGFVLANGSLSSNTSGEGEIRKNLIQNGLVDCIVAMPSQLFYTTPIPACLWFVSRDRYNHKFRDRHDEILFIDARKMGIMVTRKNRELTEEDLEKITGTYHSWRNKDGKYEDVKGFCKAAKIEEVEKNSFILTPGGYVGTDFMETDNRSFEEKIEDSAKTISAHYLKAISLQTKAQTAFKKIGYATLAETEFSVASNELLEKIAHDLFNHWFVDFEFPDKNGKPYKSSDGKFADSELGEIPMGWKVKSLDEIGIFLNGLALQKYPAESSDKYLPVIKIRELKNGITDATDKAAINIPSEYILQSGDVVFSWSGSLEVVIWCGGAGALNQHLFKVTSDKYPKWFYYQWTKHFLPIFQGIASDKAVTMGHIKRGHLTESRVLVPDDETLSKMDEVMKLLIEMVINNSVEK